MKLEYAMAMWFLVIIPKAESWHQDQGYVNLYEHGLRWPSLNIGNQSIDLDHGTFLFIRSIDSSLSSIDSAMHAWLKLSGGLIKYYPYNVLDQTYIAQSVMPKLGIVYLGVSPKYSVVDTPHNAKYAT